MKTSIVARAAGACCSLHYSYTRTLLLTSLLFGACPDIARADHPTVAFGSEASGPINTIAATALPRGTLALGLRHEYIDRDAISDARLASFGAAGVSGVHSVDTINSASVAFAYGLTDTISVSVRLPWVARHDIREAAGAHGHHDGEADDHDHDHDHHDDEAETDSGVDSLGNASGIGDLVVLGNWQAWHGADFDAAIQLGFKAPTGRTHETHDGARLESEFQPGSGSWDALFGAALSRTRGRWGVHGNLLYNLTTEGAQDTELGDGLFYNLAVVYALSAPHEHHHKTGLEQSEHRDLRFDAVLELNGETRWKNQIGGRKEANSGGTVVYLSPGLRASYGPMGAFVSLGYPMVDDARGIQTEVNFRLIGGVSYLF